MTRWRRLADGTDVEAVRVMDVCGVRALGQQVAEQVTLPHVDGRPGWVIYGGHVFMITWADWLVVDQDTGQVHPMPEATLLAGYVPVKPPR